eukprot:CAMPEP_0198321730 /NCGR_PEP_ID=MMETSP1450-20131203/10382_1 /TAXON_ID=753684 ORGANISM="Madagascaria erythrocladiodes, Strain CCMP3234" /NCGR_SAMPLE_ID=MMETSP1450 /ASSEMBLY_ACC=CAM_ASM_001115 /LENGTH=592 /DNA_ID=CAMNT_0044025309 /DNA_START=36 /DNA_END=1814 /DNA_ORIENTATION=+
MSAFVRPQCLGLRRVCDSALALSRQNTSLVAGRRLGSTRGNAFIGSALALGDAVTGGVRTAANGVGVRMTAAAPMAASTPTGSLPLPTIGVGSLDDFSGDTIVLGMLEAGKDADFELPPIMKALDEKLGGVVSNLVTDMDFKGKSGSSEMIYVPSNETGIRRLAIYGLGEAEESSSGPSVDSIRKITAYGVKTAKSVKGAQDLGIVLPGATQAAVQAAADAAIVAAFSDERFKSSSSDEDSEDKKEEIASVTLLEVDAAASKADVDNGKSIASGVILTKELVMAPPNVVNPVSLAETAESIASDCGLEIEILDREECEKRGMGAYLGVSQGSVYPPKFIHMTYKPSEKAEHKICLIGKGLTFDSGGYNLKTGFGSMIELMKFDMGGSASVLGAAKAIGQLKPKAAEVHFIVAACENMVSDKAFRPGDILTASNGTTIEIGNTDAEGRLTLADALVFADSLGDVDCIIDLATLTGAIIISLGNEYAGLFTPNDDLAKQLTAAGEKVGEKMWRMPLPAEYLELTKSKVADLKNTGGRGAGSITAALFLQEFVKNSPWAHLDIAGTVWAEKAGGPTGYGVRTLVEFVQDFEKIPK